MEYVKAMYKLYIACTDVTKMQRNCLKNFKYKNCWSRCINAGILVDDEDRH